jgi:hypothetical protein
MESPSALAVTEVDEKLELHRLLKRIVDIKGIVDIKAVWRRSLGPWPPSP